MNQRILNYIKTYKSLQKTIGRIFLPILFPFHCPVCGEIVPFGSKICPDCYKLLPFVEEPRCLCCGKPVSDDIQEYCYDCRIFPKSFQGGISLFLYNHITRPAMVDYKYHNRRLLTGFYAEELLYRYYPLIKKWQIRALVPVPVHSMKRKSRGYNQAELISRRLAEDLDLNHYPDMLIRQINTLPQKQFTPQARLNNLNKAFHLNPKYRGMKEIPESVLLIDDIYTTGATMEACARILLGAGIGRVYVCTICIGTARD